MRRGRLFDPGPLSIHPSPLSIILRLSKFCDTMRKLRVWLDGEKIYPAQFKTAVDACGYAFTIGFRNIDDANRFRARFGAQLRPSKREQVGMVAIR